MARNLVWVAYRVKYLEIFRKIMKTLIGVLAFVNGATRALARYISVGFDRFCQPDSHKHKSGRICAWVFKWVILEFLTVPAIGRFFFWYTLMNMLTIFSKITLFVLMILLSTLIATGPMIWYCFQYLKLIFKGLWMWLWGGLLIIILERLNLFHSIV